MKAEDKITISINDISITIPKIENTEDVIIAFTLALELYGWHRDTINQSLWQYVEQLND